MADIDALREPGVPVRIPEVTTPGQPVPGAVPPVAPPADEQTMSLVDHLSELRRRIVISVLAVAIGALVGFVIAPTLIKIMIQPLPPEFQKLQVFGVGDQFFINLKLALITGVVLAMPVILWQLWAFISPGLTTDERRLARPWVPVALGLFLLGVGVAYVVLPFALQFLLSFQSDIISTNLEANKYFDFLGTMFLAFGLVMEFPIVLVLLSKAGIITSARLKSSRRIVVLGIAIFAAIATPGGDIISPLVMGGVMYLLYEVSILLVRAGGR